MRVFSNFDKIFIQNILALDKADEKLLYVNKFLKGLIKTNSHVYIEGRPLKYELKEGEFHYHKIEIQGEENNPEDYFTFTSAFYAANDLLDYLLKNGYLLRHEGSAFIRMFINGIPEDGKKIVKREIYVNKTLVEFLDKLLYDYIPTEALKDLSQNKFRTKEERHSRTTRIIAVISALISIGGLALNYYINNHKSAPNEPQTIIIDKSSLNQILKEKNNRLTIDTNSIKFLIGQIEKQKKAKNK